MTHQRVRVVVVSDTPVLREGLSALLEAHLDVVDAVSPAQAVDVVVYDLRGLSRHGGDAELRRLCGLHPVIGLEFEPMPPDLPRRARDLGLRFTAALSTSSAELVELVAAAAVGPVPGPRTGRPAPAPERERHLLPVDP